MVRAYYNENDPEKCAWLRELIRRNAIAPGDVDERFIEDVRPDDVRGYRQCHWFGGIGIWSYALRLAGWPDDREVWTGSCPCQPFSDAGKKAAFDDARHLWPVWAVLIAARRPLVVFGEQVASADGLAWFDAVYLDLGNAGYACGAVDLCAAGFGAPHRRQRLFFVAHSERGAAEPQRFAVGGTAAGAQGEAHQRERLRDDAGDGVNAGVLAHAAGERHDGWRASGAVFQPGAVKELERFRDAGILADAGGAELEARDRQAQPARDGDVGVLADGAGDGRGQEREDARGDVAGDRAQGWPAGLVPGGDAGGMAHADGERWGIRFSGPNAAAGAAESSGSETLGSSGDQPGRPGAVNGWWRDADWIFCRDRKWRPVEAGTFPLAHGSAGRVVRLRGYGDSINAPAAAEFIQAFMSIEDGAA